MTSQSAPLVATIPGIPSPPAADIRVIARRGKGLGVVANRAFPPGATVLAFAGPVLDRRDVLDFTYVLEIGPGTFLGASGGPDDYVNHSCRPSCYVAVTEGGAVELRAARGIRAHEEVTFDYSTTMVTDLTRFRCHCSTRLCRGVVVPFAELPEAVRHRYLSLGHVPAFVQDTESVVECAERGRGRDLRRRRPA